MFFKVLPQPKQQRTILPDINHGINFINTWDCCKSVKVLTYLNVGIHRDTVKRFAQR